MRKSIFSKSALTLLTLAALSCDKNEETAQTTLPDSAVNTAPSLQAQSFNASEEASDTEIFGTVVATDAEGDSLTYSLKTNSDDLFKISTDGAISLASGKVLEYKTAATHKLSVEVSDGDLKSNGDVTIDVIEETRVLNIVDGLVVHFTFDNTLEDSTGNISNAKIVGNVTAAKDRSGVDDKAYQLQDGAYIEISNDSLLVDNDFEFTLAVWAKADTRNSQQSLFSKAFDYQLLVTPATNNLPTGDLYWGIGDDQGDWGETRRLFLDRDFLRGRWHHYTLVLTKSSVKTYIDGVLKNTTIITESSLKNSGTKLLVGGKEYPSNGNIDNFFRGSIDDLRYYNKALTASEVLSAASIE